MRPGGPPRGADIADHLSRGDLHPRRYARAELVEVGVAGLLSARVVDVDHVAVAAPQPGDRDPAAACGIDRSARRRSPVHAVVVAVLFQDRMEARPEIRGLGARDRHDEPRGAQPARPGGGPAREIVAAKEPVLALLRGDVAGHLSRRPVDADEKQPAGAGLVASLVGQVEDRDLVALGGEAVEVVGLAHHDDQLAHQRGRQTIPDRGGIERVDQPDLSGDGGGAAQFTRP